MSEFFSMEQRSLSGAADKSRWPAEPYRRVIGAEGDIMSSAGQREVTLA